MHGAFAHPEMLTNWKPGIPGQSRTPSVASVRRGTRVRSRVETRIIDFDIFNWKNGTFFFEFECD